MSVTNVTKKSMRILALPLVTASKAPGTSSSGPLSYYHFATPPVHKEGNTKSWPEWATDKASGLWAGLGKAKEGSWQRRTFVYGERLVDRIDFEELALKSLDPSLGPSLTRFGHSKSDIKPEDSPTIPLIYPGQILTSPLSHLQSLLAKRTPKHKRGFYTWMIISPFTAPFMIIPIIPNLPFFFCVWRSWSHYKAYKASSYLEQLLEKGSIVPQDSAELNAIYAAYAPSAPSANEPQQAEDSDSDASSSPRVNNNEHLLLTRDAVPAITAYFDTGPSHASSSSSSLAADLYRAIEQAALRVRNAEPNSGSKPS
ncbi:mitochondrial K+-H+ exchange-related-domain-containing protein [Cytidiella melzeri]|nr:mitochondrial K+-H+ exchange-related-domain-containing protein [Cytidiella melzeri]